jgi:hypothetical protein
MFVVMSKRTREPEATPQAKFKRQSLSVLLNEASVSPSRALNGKISKKLAQIENDDCTISIRVRLWQSLTHAIICRSRNEQRSVKMMTLRRAIEHKLQTRAASGNTLEKRENVQDSRNLNMSHNR